MPYRPTNLALNATTLKILNTIRANASMAYRDAVPDAETLKDIPKVGESITGTPGLANEFIPALLNRIAFVAISSATFNNRFAPLKKGVLQYGEVIENIFVEMTKAVDFNPEKANSREFARNLPDVKSLFHTVNWRVMYPITISRKELEGAFTSADGVTNLITRIFNAIYTAAEYDEYLLFKYLIIKAVAHGEMKPVPFDSADMSKAAVAFRATSSELEFPKTKYNFAGVHNSTPRDRQYIFMDAQFNAAYDVNVLAAAFHMDKAQFMGNLVVVDSFTEFDNERFSEIRANSAGDFGTNVLEEVTAAELALMADVKAITVDKEWFACYDKPPIMDDTKVGSGLYWNYWYHTWKVIASNPFANAVVFVDDGAATLAQPTTYTAKVVSKDVNDNGVVVNWVVYPTDASGNPAERLSSNAYNFVQTQALTTDGVAVHPFGGYTVPDAKKSTAITMEIDIGGVRYSSAENTAQGAAVSFTPVSVNVGSSLTVTKVTA